MNFASNRLYPVNPAVSDAKARNSTVLHDVDSGAPRGTRKSPGHSIVSNHTPIRLKETTTDWEARLGMKVDTGLKRFDLLRR